VKFAETGDVRWRFQLNGSADHFDLRNAVAVDGTATSSSGRDRDLPGSIRHLQQHRSTVMKLARTMDDCCGGAIMTTRRILGTLGRSVVDTTC
jgi:hypothetical protein